MVIMMMSGQTLIELTLKKLLGKDFKDDFPFFVVDDLLPALLLPLPLPLPPLAATNVTEEEMLPKRKKQKLIDVTQEKKNNNGAAAAETEKLKNKLKVDISLLFMLCCN
jgi:hypothetical protein